MKSSDGLFIGLFEEDQHLAIYLRSLLSLAGHQVSLHQDAEREFVDLLLAILGTPATPPYDLLIIHVWLGGPISSGAMLTALQQIDALHLLPTILLVSARQKELQKLRTHLPHTPILPHYPLSFIDLFETIGALTGTPFLHSSPLFEALQRIESEQMYWHRTRERDWIKQREEWLSQREEWIKQREEWLSQREEWLETRQRQPNAQQEWLAEQQAWIKEQRVEVQQQRRWHQQLYMWLNRYSHTFDQQEPPSLSEAN